jgi:hypothetical protein
MAIGCLIPFVLLIAGAVAGAMWGGTTYGIWTAAAGFAIGIVAMLLVVRAFDRARDDLPE